MSCVMCHMSRVTCHMSHVTCHLSHVTCHIFFCYCCFFGKVVKLIGGGSVINGAYFEVPFNCLFAPTSRSWMSNIFRDSESLGKSNGKKWYNIWIFLLGSGRKSPRKKKFFFADFALQNMVETTLPNGLETSGRRRIANFGISLDVFEFLRFG